MALGVREVDVAVRRDGNPLRTIEVSEVEGNPKMVFYSEPGASYAVEFSTDMLNWQSIAPNYPSDGYTTVYRDSGLVSRLSEIPPKAYYRSRKNAP